LLVVGCWLLVFASTPSMFVYQTFLYRGYQKQQLFSLLLGL